MHIFPTHTTRLEIKSVCSLCVFSHSVVTPYTLSIWVELKTNLSELVVLIQRVVSQSVVSRNVRNCDAKQSVVSYIQ